ncbi:MAG: hypothetical protein BWX85_00508 [Chloroflexi bacterium ADurb.Bin120]|nr:MAG: hypothetical protein BWX85_00508 [Chloroflexi bacterium ADurb.Bin120]
MGNRVISIGGINKQQPGFSIVMGLCDDFIKELTGTDHLMDLDRDVVGDSFIQVAVEGLVFRGRFIWEA